MDAGGGLYGSRLLFDFIVTRPKNGIDCFDFGGTRVNQGTGTSIFEAVTVGELHQGNGKDDGRVIYKGTLRRDERKHMLGITEGGSENAIVVKGLLDDLIERGLDPSKSRLYVLDGGKTLHKGVIDVFGKEALIQCCQVRKKRNVLSYLPKSEQTNISKALTMAYRGFDYANAKDKLLSIVKRLENRYPKAAASLSESLEETLMVHGLKVPGLLRETLCSTNPTGSANSACRGIKLKLKPAIPTNMGNLYL